MHPNNRRLVRTKGPSRQLRCHAIVQHAAVSHACILGGLHVSVHMPHAAIFFPSLLAGLCSFRLIPFGFGRPRKPWPTCHCAWRCACTAATKFGGVPRGTEEAVTGYSQSTHGVL